MMEGKRVKSFVQEIPNFVTWIILIGTFLLIGQGFYEQFWPIKTIKVDQPVKILTKNVHAGDELEYQVHFCRYTDGLGKVTRTLYGPVVVPTPVVASVADKGCRTVNVLFPLPSELPVGEYYIKWVAEFPINSKRTITVVYESEKFNIVEGKIK